MDKQFVRVYLDTLDHHLHVDQNVSLVLSVPLMKHVIIRNVGIHALVLVVLLPNVWWLVITQFVVALRVILVIHLFDAP